MLSIRSTLLAIGGFICGITYCQDTTVQLTSKISSQYFDAVSKKAGIINECIDKKTRKVLNRMQKHESKLQRKLSKIDSIAANNIFSNSDEKFDQLKEKLKDREAKLSQYIPKLDTIATSFRFLEQHSDLIHDIKDVKQKLCEAGGKFKDLQLKLQNADDIKKFLKERKEYLKQQLEKFGLAKELKRINKEVYYYSQQLNEYKEIFKDSKKAERKVIELLSKTKLFQDFMKKNGMLARLFGIPGNTGNVNYVSSFAGLQTRFQVNALIQNQLTAGGPNAQQVFQQNIQQGQAQLQQLKNQLNKAGLDGSDNIMPEGFKPNHQKGKSFFQRLEYGSNIQTQQSSYFFPVTTDVGLSVGYKLNDKSIIGVGASYKIGWGKAWNNISITQQGIGVRSFIDWKIKGSFWISGGYEKNYISAMQSIAQPRDSAIRQQSGLIGISKIVTTKNKVLKKTRIQILWDFLSYQQTPRSNPILFRVGYNF